MSIFVSLRRNDYWGTTRDARELYAWEKEEVDSTITGNMLQRHYYMSIHMLRARAALAKHGLLLFDTPYDGACTVWACMPALARYLNRPVTVEDTRVDLVLAMRSPALRDILEEDLRQTNRDLIAQGNQPFACTDDLLTSYLQPHAFLHTILAARAMELLTNGGRIQVLSHDSHDMWTMYESPGTTPFILRLFLEPFIEHVGIVRTIEEIQN